MEDLQYHPIPVIHALGGDLGRVVCEFASPAYYLVVSDDSIDGPYRSDKGRLHLSGCHNNGMGYLLSHYVYIGRPARTRSCIHIIPMAEINDDVWYFAPYDELEEPMFATGSEDPSGGQTSDEQSGYWIHIDLTREFTDNP